MARIRTVKPEFFRHEGLQDLEIANPGKYPMMVFAGLWGHCDRDGRFEWRPRQLKLDILPFLPFDMAEVLGILEHAGFIESYLVDGKRYGVIRSFKEHQRLSGKESQEGGKYPEPFQEEQGSTGEIPVKQQGSTGEIPESQEGKGREGKGEEEGKGCGEGDETPPALPAATSKGSRIPNDWQLPKLWGEWAMKERGWPQATVRLVAEKFKDHWIAQPGRAGTKTDWFAMWRNWVRNEAGKTEEPARVGTPPTVCCCCGAKATYSSMGKSYCSEHDKYSIEQAVAA